MSVTAHNNYTRAQSEGQRPQNCHVGSGSSNPLDILFGIRDSGRSLIDTVQDFVKDPTPALSTLWNKALNGWQRTLTEARDPNTWTLDNWQRAWNEVRVGVSLGLDLIPVIGDIKGGIEGLVGYDLAGNKLSKFEQSVAIAGALLGMFTIADELVDAGKLLRHVANNSDFAGDMAKAGRGLGHVDELAGTAGLGRHVDEALDTATSTRLRNLDAFTSGSQATKQSDELRQAFVTKPRGRGLNRRSGSLSERLKATAAHRKAGNDLNDPSVRYMINRGLGPIQGGSGAPVRGPDGLESPKQIRTRLGIPEKGKPNTLITKIRDWAYGYNLDPKNYALWTIKSGEGGTVVGRNGEVLSDGKYMYVVDKNNNIRYLPTDPATSGEIQYRAHTQLAGGENVWGAGLFEIEDGKFKLVNTGSGHYKPTKVYLDYTEELLKKQGFHTKSAEFKPYIPDHPLWHPKEIYRLSKDVAGTIHVGTQRLLLGRMVQERINRPTIPPELEDLLPY